MNTASGSFFMNEEALARLEAGLRAQREKLSSAPLQPSPGISPADNSEMPSSPPKRDPIDIPSFLSRHVDAASD